MRYIFSATGVCILAILWIVFLFVMIKKSFDYDERIKKAEDNSRLKDSLYLECNGKIKQLNNNFLYKNYLKNHGN